MFVIQRRPAIARVAGARLTVESLDLHAVHAELPPERAAAPAQPPAYGDRVTRGWTPVLWRGCTTWPFKPAGRSRASAA